MQGTPGNGRLARDFKKTVTGMAALVAKASVEA